MSWKFFNPGQILTADDANTLMRQGRAIVANTTERNAISAVEGQRVYQLDNKTEYEYRSGAWVGGWQTLTFNGADGAEFKTLTGAEPGWILIGGVIYLRGLILPVSNPFPTANKHVITLPVAARPGHIVVDGIASDGESATAATGAARIDVDGSISINAIGSATRMWLSSLSYPATPG